jgi:hypothetical protein
VVDDWLGQQRRIWEQHTDRLERFVTTDQEDER